MGFKARLFSSLLLIFLTISATLYLLHQAAPEVGKELIQASVLLVSVTCLLGFWLLHDYRRGVARLNHGLQAVVQGQLGYQLELDRLYELTDTVKAFNHMSHQLAVVAHEQQALYQDLLARDQRLEVILNNTEEGIIGLDNQLNVTIANRAALRLLQTETAQTVNLHTCLPIEVQLQVRQLQSPDNQQQHFHVPERCISNTQGQPVPVEIRGSRLMLNPQESVVLLSLRNLSVEQSIRQDFEQQNSIKAALMDASLDSILLMDNQGDCQHYNISMFNLFERLTGQHREMSVAELLELDLRTDENLIDALDRLELINTGIHSCKRLAASGDVLHLEFNIQAFDARGQLHYTLVISDISEKVKNQHRLEQAILDADAANVAKSQFLAAMSHEIRTPLNGIQGSIALLSHSELSGPQRELVQAAGLCSQALMQLINDILDFAKIEAGKMELEVLELSLKNILQEAVTIIRPRAQEKNLALNLQCDPAIRHCVLADAGRLRQICLNLLSNAVKFTDSGTITLYLDVLDTKGAHGIPQTKSDTDPHQQATPAKPEQPDLMPLRIRVSDPGIGIPVEKQSLLFSEFTQVNQTDSRRHGGSGLGLAISQKLADLMDGYILFSSTPGQGSDFCLYLTLPVTATPADALPETSMNPVQHKELRSGRILIVEDSITNQMVAGRMLNVLNQQYEVANNGVEALEAIRQRPFDLILMDLQMPEMDGYEATRVIRSLPQWQNTPIIAMTANVMTSDKEACFSVGMNDFLAKPMHLEAVARILHRWLDHAPAASLPEVIPVAAAPAEQTAQNSEPAPLFSVAAMRQMETDIGADRCSQMIDIVLKELKKRQNALQQAFRQQDGDNVQHQAHTLKSTSASFGLIALSDTAKRIEHFYRWGSDDNIQKLVSALPDLLDQSEQALCRYREQLATS